MRNSLKRQINRRINSIIGVSLQAIENHLLPNSEESYREIRYKIMKVANDMVRKIDSDIENYSFERDCFNYQMPFIGDNTFKDGVNLG